MTLPSTTHLKEKSTTKSDSSLGLISRDFLSKNLGASNFDKIDENKNHSNGDIIRKPRRGIQFDDNKENRFINNLIIDEESNRKSFTEIKRQREFEQLDDRNLINIEIRKELDFNETDDWLDKIEENELENLESSTERLGDFEDIKEPEIKTNTKLSNFMDNQPQTNLFSKENSWNKGHHHRSNSSFKESVRYSATEEDNIGSTLTKFIDNADLKYTTNNSEIRKRQLAEEKYYEEDVDGVKKLIDFQNLSHLKDTPNISNASNLKSYGRYDSESNKINGKKFTRHTRGNSIFDSEGIPVKEVCIYDYNEIEEDRIKNLKSF